MRKVFERGDRVSVQIMRHEPGKDPYPVTLRGAVVGHSEGGGGTVYNVDWGDGTTRTHLPEQLNYDASPQTT